MGPIWNPVALPIWVPYGCPYGTHVVWCCGWVGWGGLGPGPGGGGGGGGVEAGAWQGLSFFLAMRFRVRVSSYLY